MNTVTKAPSTKQQSTPVVPPLLAKPIHFLPARLHTSMIVKLLNVFLAQALIDGELDFLKNKSVSVEISDLKLRFALSLYNGRLIPSQWLPGDHLNLSGNLYDFMLLASRKEDSDAMFFHRRLKMEGDTDLGLEVKNLLDGIDTETVRFHKQIDFVLHHSIKAFERLFK